MGCFARARQVAPSARLLRQESKAQGLLLTHAHRARVALALWAWESERSKPLGQARST